jgi:hypothetical protein
MPNITDANQNGNGQGEPEPMKPEIKPAEDQLDRLIQLILEAHNACLALHHYIATDRDNKTGLTKHFNQEWVEAARLLAYYTLCAFDELDYLGCEIADGKGSFRELIGEFPDLQYMLGRYSGST